MQYLEVRSRPDNLFGTGIPLLDGDGVEQELRTCLVCSLNTKDRRENDLDLNFVAGNRNISIYFQSGESNLSVIGAIVNLSGYVVDG